MAPTLVLGSKKKAVAAPKQSEKKTDKAPAAATDEAKIVSILKELEAGTSAASLGRRHGVHPNTIGNWKQKYGAEAWAVLEKYSGSLA